MYTCFISMKKNLFLKFLFICFIALSSNFTFAETLSNAGLTGDKILVSNESPVAREMVRISMPFYNESGGLISGVARLYNNDKKIAEKTFSLKVGEFSGFSLEWNAVPGINNFVLKLEDTFITLPKKEKTIVVLKNREARTTIYTQGSVKEETIFKEYAVESETQVVPQSGSGIDAYRQDFLIDAEKKITDIRKDITESVKQNQQYEKRLQELRSALPRSDGSLLTPVQYLYAWVLGAVAYILSNAYLFYGICGLIILLILRFIIRKIHRHGNRHS